MSEKPTGFIICRGAREALKPGYTFGHDCAICKKGLQISPTGRETLAKRPSLLTLCNRCGFQMYERLERAGKEFETMYSPGFLESFESFIKKGEVP